MRNGKCLLAKREARQPGATPLRVKLPVLLLVCWKGQICKVLVVAIPRLLFSKELRTLSFPFSHLSMNSVFTTLKRSQLFLFNDLMQIARFLACFRRFLPKWRRVGINFWAFSQKYLYFSYSFPGSGIPSFWAPHAWCPHPASGDLTDLLHHTLVCHPRESSPLCCQSIQPQGRRSL